MRIPRCLHPINVTRRYLVFGKVQGVYFRHSARLAAKRLGLRGSARNLPDGSVEVVVQGTIAALEAMRQWLQQGPEQARVDQVREFSVGEEFKTQLPEEFQIL